MATMKRRDTRSSGSFKGLPFWASKMTGGSQDLRVRLPIGFEVNLQEVSGLAYANTDHMGAYWKGGRLYILQYAFDDLPREDLELNSDAVQVHLQQITINKASVNVLIESWEPEAWCDIDLESVKEWHFEGKSAYKLLTGKNPAGYDAPRAKLMGPANIMLGAMRAREGRVVLGSAKKRRAAARAARKKQMTRLRDLKKRRR